MPSVTGALITLGLLTCAVPVQEVTGTYFYGSHADQLAQWSNVLRLKAIVKAKAFDCKRQHFCLKGTIKRLLLNSSLGLDNVMLYLSEHHPGIAGAIATGWMRKDCQTSFPRCNQKLLVVSNSVPCQLGEVCYRDNDKSTIDSATTPHAVQPDPTMNSTLIDETTEPNATRADVEGTSTEAVDTTGQPEQN